MTTGDTLARFFWLVEAAEADNPPGSVAATLYHHAAQLARHAGRISSPAFLVALKAATVHHRPGPGRDQALSDLVGLAPPGIPAQASPPGRRQARKPTPDRKPGRALFRR